MESIARVSKAIAGAATSAAALGVGQGTGIVQIIPADVTAPWYAHVLVYFLTAVVTFAGVYISPPNSPPSAK